IDSACKNIHDNEDFFWRCSLLEGSFTKDPTNAASPLPHLPTPQPPQLLDISYTFTLHSFSVAASTVAVSISTIPTSPSGA
ncbi:hypothetical protein BaRGS_00016583, partial [Batillaria attramentaria]